MGLPLLLAGPGGAVPPAGAVGDKLRQTERLHRRRAGFALDVHPRGSGSQRGGADPRTLPPGSGRSLPDDELPRPPAGRLRRAGGARGRALDGLHERRHAARPAGGRRARGVGLVALDLLPQLAARRRNRRSRAPRPLRRTGAAAGRPARLPGRRAGRAGVRRPDVRPRRRSARRLRRPRLDVRRRSCGAHGVRPLRTARGRAHAPVRSLQTAELRGSEPRDVHRLRRPLRYVRLLHDLPAISRFLALRGWSHPGPHERCDDRAGRVSARWQTATARGST